MIYEESFGADSIDYVTQAGAHPGREVSEPAPAGRRRWGGGGYLPECLWMRRDAEEDPSDVRSDWMNEMEAGPQRGAGIWLSLIPEAQETGAPVPAAVRIRRGRWQKS